MKILGVDPGSLHSGIALYDSDLKRFTWAVSEFDNEDFIVDAKILRKQADINVIEMPKLYGQRQVQASLLETCIAAGRLFEALGGVKSVVWLPRGSVKMHLLGFVNRKGINPDSAIAAAINERFPGGKGTKKAPGPLYGLTTHAMQAAALCLTYDDLKGDFSQI